jgi:class 3 adenylate cyclase
MRENQTSGRLDFESEIVSFDQRTGRLVQRMRLRPDRYEQIEWKGQRAWLDKADRLVITESVLNEALKGIVGMYSSLEEPDVEGLEAHLGVRRKSIASRLDGLQSQTPCRDRSQEELSKFSGNPREFVFLAIDMVSSTLRGIQDKAVEYADLVTIFLDDLSETISLYHGHVLNYAGDGCIAFFPSPSFTIKHDLAFLCAIALRRVVHESLNSELRTRGIKPVEIRIGIESGCATPRTVGSSKTKRQRDLLGSPISLAAKIQGRANPGEVLIGEYAMTHLYTPLRQMCEAIDLGPKWPYRNDDGSEFAVFRLT